MNLFLGNTEILSLCEKENLASLNRGPLAMGILSGKFNRDSVLPEDDCRSSLDKHGDPYYLFFRDGKPIPIPGFKTVKQVEENAGAMAYGPLKSAQMEEIDRILVSMREME